MRKLILVGMGRENSVRVPQKMIRKFGNTTLFDIYLNSPEPQYFLSFALEFL
jgi:hypothetical protein